MQAYTVALNGEIGFREALALRQDLMEAVRTQGRGAMPRKRILTASDSTFIRQIASLAPSGAGCEVADAKDAGA